MKETTISNFEYVSLKKHMKIQGYKKDSQRHKNIIHYLKLREKQTPCEVCGNIPIWVAGSSLCDWPGCFTCITGESDASDDYEVI